ncbi:hypothetical protein [Streptomyces sp. NPDC060031]|uniref:hypothetical protein n=1 Tax=Streptomyces sp. NPDC060031 TaxID=3347043 RepID=UPI00367B7378
MTKAPEAARLVEDLLTAGLQAGFRRHAAGDWSHARSLARGLRRLVDALPQQSAVSP